MDHHLLARRCSYVHLQWGREVGEGCNGVTKAGIRESYSGLLGGFEGLVPTMGFHFSSTVNLLPEYNQVPKQDVMCCHLLTELRLSFQVYFH